MPVFRIKTCVHFICLWLHCASTAISYLGVGLFHLQTVADTPSSRDNLGCCHYRCLWRMVVAKCHGSQPLWTWVGTHLALHHAWVTLQGGEVFPYGGTVSPHSWLEQVGPKLLPGIGLGSARWGCIDGNRNSRELGIFGC